MRAFWKGIGEGSMEKTIMIVDDDVITRKIAAKTLKRSYEVYSYASGTEALAAIETVRPNLVLADLHMPEMSGTQLMEKIRQLPEERLSQVPVVIMTSDVDTDSEVRGFDLGVSDYIRKPLLSEVLNKRIDRVIRNDEERQHLSMQAHFDELTGLLNRRAGTQIIDRYLIEEQGQGTLLMMDIDRFKSINDTLGHRIGDQALVAVSDVLKQFVRSGDVVSRLAGDEFIIFYRGFTEPHLISERCRDITEQVKERLYELPGAGPGLCLGISMGIAGAPEDGRDFETLYRKADEAMYRVKQSGRGGFCFYDRRGMEDSLSLSQLMKRVDEVTVQGAYEVKLEDFFSICRFLKRSSERSGSHMSAQLILFTAHEDEEHYRELPPLESRMHSFGCLLGQTIRRGDVYVRLSDTQYMALLIGTDEEKARQAVSRVLGKRVPACGNEMDISYELNPLVS